MAPPHLVDRLRAEHTKSRLRCGELSREKQAVAQHLAQKEEEYTALQAAHAKVLEECQRQQAQIQKLLQQRAETSEALAVSRAEHRALEASAERTERRYQEDGYEIALQRAAAEKRALREAAKRARATGQRPDPKLHQTEMDAALSGQVKMLGELCRDAIDRRRHDLERDAKLVATAQEMSSALTNEDVLMTHVAPCLTYMDLFSLVKTTKEMRLRLTHEHALTAVLLNADDKFGKNAKATIRNVLSLYAEGKIHKPSPMRLLRLANGKRCEFGPPCDTPEARKVVKTRLLRGKPARYSRSTLPTATSSSSVRVMPEALRAHATCPRRRVRRNGAWGVTARGA